MFKVGLTGGIGSGKSLVADIFSRLGVPVYISDVKAKELMNSNAELIRALKQEFGNDIYNGTELNRKALADIIFND
ncbi:MAG: dephospho-CoA kinase, partial [Bacteroidia bacterium]|nr:dephospho-CoA kinase [Bacteroidia bacterium]NNM15272.1 dephospho-CoA kinase [Bacteroidia bacterium]